MPTVMIINGRHDGKSEDDNDGQHCKLKAMSNDTVMAVLMLYYNGHHNGPLLWPSWWDIVLAMIREDTVMGVAMMEHQVLSLSRHKEYRGRWRGSKYTHRHEMSKCGPHQSIEVALDCFVVSRSIEDGIKVLSRGWNRRAFIFWVLEKTKILQESQKSLPDRRKADQVVSNPLDKLSKNCRDEKLLKTCKGNPLVFLPIAMDPLCDWAQLEPWVIAPNLFIKS